MPDVQAFCGTLRLYCTCEPRYISCSSKHPNQWQADKGEGDLGGSIAGSGRVRAARREQLSGDRCKRKSIPMAEGSSCIVQLQTRWLERGHSLLGSIMEVSSLLSIAVVRLAAGTSSRLGLLFPGAGHYRCTSIPFCAWPTIHHCGGHCPESARVDARTVKPRPGARDR